MNIKDLNKLLDYIVQISDYQKIYQKPYINIDYKFIYNIIKEEEIGCFNMMVDIQLSFDNAFLIAKALSPYAHIYDIIKLLSNALGNSLIPSKLKNEKFIELLDKEYLTFERLYIDILRMIYKNFSLDDINNTFLESWNKSYFFKSLFSKPYSYFENLISNIYNIPDLKKIFKLLYYDEKNIFDKQILSKIFYQLNNIIWGISNYTEQNSKDISLFINLVAEKQKDITEIISIIGSCFKISILSDIFFYLNNKELSSNNIEYIDNFLLENIDKISEKGIITLLITLNSNILEELLIKEEIFYSNKKISFSYYKNNNFHFDEYVDYPLGFFEIIIKKEILKKYPELYENNFIKCNMEIITRIKNNIKTGEIKFRLVDKIGNYDSLYCGDDKIDIKIIKEKLNLILFNDEKEVEIYLNFMNEGKNKIYEILQYIKKMEDVIQEFYEVKYKNEIPILNNIKNEIKEGNINMIYYN